MNTNSMTVNSATALRSLEPSELAQVDGGLRILLAGIVLGAAAAYSGYFAGTAVNKSNEVDLMETVRKTLDKGGM